MKKLHCLVVEDEPEVAVFPGDPWTPPDPLRSEPVEVSDIDEALQLALGLIPADEGGEIVLFSDGRATAGAGSAGLSIAEVPVSMRMRQGGNPSHAPFRSVLYLSRALLALLVATSRPVSRGST